MVISVFASILALLGIYRYPLLERVSDDSAEVSEAALRSLVAVAQVTLSPAEREDKRAQGK